MSNITSQSELTTKEIVEQAIQDYHRDYVLPYLNGQVPVIANKFDKANLYSTDEQIVGRWKDGKPLYQKVIDFGAIPSGALYQTVYESTESYYEHAHTINTFADGIDVVCQLPLLNGASINSSIGYVMYVNSVTHKLVLRLYTAIDRSAFGHFWATVQYTKTTDEAIAIGSDTDYSLEEKIVGTWIDGKPLYQKTIEATISNSTIQSIAHDIDNIGIAFIKEGFINDNGYYNIHIDNHFIDCLITDTSIDIRKTGGDAYQNRVLYITVCYTKTTD